MSSTSVHEPIGSIVKKERKFGAITLSVQNTSYLPIQPQHWRKAAPFLALLALALQPMSASAPEAFVKDLRSTAMAKLVRTTTINAGRRIRRRRASPVSPEITQWKMGGIRKWMSKKFERLHIGFGKKKGSRKDKTWSTGSPLKNQPAKRILTVQPLIQR
jgi:hypothetical protein